MAHALEPADRFVTAAHHEQGIGLGRVGLEFVGSGRDIVWNADRTRCLVLEGELYDTGGLTQALGVERRDAESDASLLLRLYEQFGDGFLSRVNGAFAAAVWDRPERRLVVFNDRFGLFPVYYARPNGDLLFASGVRALLADPSLERTVDRVALNQFLVFDHMLDDRTLLAGARLLPQAAVLSCTDGHLSLHQYWTPRYPEVYEPQPERSYVDGFVHHLKQAVKRQSADDLSRAVLLSGGMDSRLLLGPLVERGGTVDTLTFGIPGCDDASVAAEVASALRTRHHFFELKPDWLAGLAGEAVRITDGNANIVNMHVLATNAEQARHGQVLYKGFMGDALLGFALKPQMWADYRPQDREGVHLGVHTSQGVINYTRDEQQSLFTDAFRGDVGDGVYEAYRDGMERSGVAQLGNQRLYFDLTQRVPRMTLNGVEAARSHAAVRLPFCDNDLVDFALTIPPGFLFERRLSKFALIDHFPELARIPLASTGRPMTACARDLWIQAKGLLAWHLRRHGLASFAPGQRRPYKDYDNWLRTVLRPWMEGILLDRRTLDRGYFQPAYIRRLVSDHAAGTNHAVRLGALLSVELWHRQFVD